MAPQSGWYGGIFILRHGLPSAIDNTESHLGKTLRLFSLLCFIFFYMLPVGNCDNCTVLKQHRDMSKEAFLLLACIHSCKGRWGLNMPIDILRGSRVSCSKLKVGSVLVSSKSNLSSWVIFWWHYFLALFIIFMMHFQYWLLAYYHCENVKI